MTTPNDAIDTMTINALRGLFDDECQAQTFINELIDIFRDSGTETVQQLLGKVAQNDLPAVSRHAHKLKGLSYNIGAGRVATLCAELEIQAKEGPSAIDVAVGLCRTVEREFATSCDELQRHYRA